MTLISEIITEAFRSHNLVGAGQAPTTAETAEALTLLNRNIRSMFGTSLGTELTDINYGQAGITSKVYDNIDWWENLYDVVVPPNTRLVCNLESPLQLDLVDKPQDGSRFAVVDAGDSLATFPLTLNGNGRTIGGLPQLVVNTNGASLEYFYRADQGDWKLISNLVGTDVSPFPFEFDDLLIQSLAISLCSRYGVTMTQEQLTDYSRVKSRFAARYRQRIQVPSEAGLLYTDVRYNRYYYGSRV